MIANEKIKAADVHLFGLEGEDLGIVPTREALELAKKHKVDLMCTSLLTSPPPCRLIAKGKAKEQEQASRERKSKVKELRLTPQIEEHDLDTKRLQAERILKAGDSVLLTVKISGKQGQQARELCESLIRDLKPLGRPKTGVQVSGKQAAVQVDPI
ncbi:translation initiation factor IF-3 [Gorillibacterium timonense]|uniref:translation initiation factor IF-3 n=1 Tax=Gorillibacterium timonense TaxID=1689269 RepID=UPI00071E51CB|nr:translation initiation factor IF-3 [Gorillibacterium timonense]